jgi:plasmid stabilization system protein ParE
MRVKWTRKALVNLDDAIEYIAGDNPTASRNVARKIWDNSQMLAFQPAIFCHTYRKVILFTFFG